MRWTGSPAMRRSSADSICPAGCRPTIAIGRRQWRRCAWCRKNARRSDGHRALRPRCRPRQASRAHGAGPRQAACRQPQPSEPMSASSLVWWSEISASMTSSSFAHHHPVELVERQVDAVVGEATLREIVGADALRAVARADLRLARRGALLVGAAALHVVEAGAQDLHGAGPVLVLRFFRLDAP